MLHTTTSSESASQPSGTSSKILIIGPSWVGDMVMAQSLFMSIKKQTPTAVIDVLAPSWSRPIIERMPEVNKAIDMPLGHGRFEWGTRKQLGQELRHHAYTQAIVLPNSWKSALIPWFANIPVRTGWKGELRYGLLNNLRHLDKSIYPLMVQRFVALAFPKNHKPISPEDCPAPLLIANSQKVPTLLKKFDLSTEQPILILCPGAEFGPAKQWPAHYYSQVANHMASRNWQVWIMGSEADKAIASDIATQSNSRNIHNLCGRTTLEDAIDLMSLATQVISNDSGLMHIASALDKPLVALYGATSPEFTPPLSEQAHIIATDVDCGPCFQRTCPEGHHKCMQLLTPDSVIGVIDR